MNSDAVTAADPTHGRPDLGGAERRALGEPDDAAPSDVVADRHGVARPFALADQSPGGHSPAGGAGLPGPVTLA